MVNLLNNKLYTQYYPLTSEEDKNNFLKSNYMEIYKFVRNIGCSARNEYSLRQYNYTKKMKPTVSFLGTPKYRNIVHNKRVAHDMSMDKRIKDIERKLPELDSLACKLMYNESENITVDELNYILRIMNTYKHRALIMFLLLLIAIIICVCAFLYL